MAARRNKSQARRNGDSYGTPGWMWLIIGAVLAGLAFLIVPGLIKKDGFDPLRPTPNPDAQPPAQIAEVDTDAAAPTARSQPRPAATLEEPEAKPTQYEFYDVLQGKEVAMSDAELAASARAEQERLDRAARAAAAADAAKNNSTAAPAATTSSTPKPIDEAPAPVAATPRPTTTKPATPATPASTTRSEANEVASAAPTNARYILQAGAFGASGDAEATKAKIAMLGLSARVESGQANGKTVYRVRMGPYGTASELAEAKKKLSAGGLPAMAIKAQ